MTRTLRLSDPKGYEINKTIAVIPARGGSKGIPRKNLRPLNGKPLIYYAITACLRSKEVDTVVVSTEDEEIALLAERFGAAVAERPTQLSGDDVTVDPVIKDAVESLEHRLDTHFDIVVTVQPTSPLLRATDLDEALTAFKDNNPVETLISAVDDRHLCWTTDDGTFVPEYEARVNRQQLPARYRETGAIIACKRHVLESGSRIGKQVDLYLMDPSRCFDIDSYTDLVLCAAILNRKKIVFVVTGSALTGSGHGYRAVLLANELVCHELCFVMTEADDIARDIITDSNYPVTVVESGGLANAVIKLNPDLVINDILDTERAYVHKLRSSGCKVVNFEDLGDGALEADLVVNALYPVSSQPDHVKFGPDYFCLRDEFIHAPQKPEGPRKHNILLTFGGMDEGNLSMRCLNILAAILDEAQVSPSINVILGPGYRHIDKIEAWRRGYGGSAAINIIQKTARISDYMLGADFAITSGGRTVLELCATRTPMLVICQNEREATHCLLEGNKGLVNLGDRRQVTDLDIKQEIVKLIFDDALLHLMKENLQKQDLASGKARVIELIEDVLKSE